MEKDKLKKLRQMNSMTQEQAAEYFGVKPVTWRSWEYGTRQIPEGKAEQIISALEQKLGKYYKPDNIVWGVVYTLRRGSKEQDRAIFHREKGEMLTLLNVLTKSRMQRDIITNISIYKITFVRPICAFDIISEKYINKLVDNVEIIEIPENTLPPVETKYDFTKRPFKITLNWNRVDSSNILQC